MSASERSSEERWYSAKDSQRQPLTLSFFHFFSSFLATCHQLLSSPRSLRSLTRQNRSLLQGTRTRSERSDDTHRKTRCTIDQRSSLMYLRYVLTMSITGFCLATSPSAPLAPSNAFLNASINQLTPSKPTLTLIKPASTPHPAAQSSSW